MSISNIIGRQRWPFLITLVMVLLEAGLFVLFPLLIGRAIDETIAGSYSGAIALGLLGLVTLLVGAFRRFYDSRVYAKLYRRLGGDLASQKEGTVTAKSAHLGFLTEVVEFLENSIPEIVSSLVGLVGTLVIIGTINISLMWGCLAVLMLTIIVYAATSRYTMALNTGYNQELERQVEVVSTNEPVRQKTHLKDLMRWNIRMSDLETINFSIVWILMISFLVGSIVFAVGNGIPSYGAIFSLVLYLFQFIESAIALPLFFQQGLRLKAIIRRLDNM